MSETVISVENLSKLYLLGQAERQHESLLGEVTGLLTAPFRNFRNLRRLDTSRAGEAESPDLLWALKDVSFEVKRGEVLGIIGRNGAGKSTLLKILSRITEPTKGRARIRGRVVSLLEVGTGFHPELTGRENIYLNGTILGMTRREIDRKFDEIVDFSGVERFLDTPVKRYSSGMKVRLGFAVAAHLDPDILIVDEVLAVGDAEFQKKCMGKMEDVSTRDGRTILFVSHNMASVARLCKRGIVMRDGDVAFDGPASDAVQSYFRLLSPEELGVAEGVARAVLPQAEEKPMRMLEVCARDAEGELLRCDVPYDGPLTIEIDYEVIQPIQDAYVSCCFTDMAGENAWWGYDAETPIYGRRRPGLYRARVEIPAAFLRAGTYFLRPSIVQLGQSAIDYRGSLFHITLDDRTSLLANKSIQWPSLIRFATTWSTTQIGPTLGDGHEHSVSRQLHQADTL